MSWSNRYIGTPWAEFGRSVAGVDCWGLACIIYAEELGISLPDYLGYGSVAELDEINALVDGATASPLWLPVDGPAIAFDIALFRRGRFSSHVGIVVRHGLMIHVAAHDCAKLESYRGGVWGARLRGHWRHSSRAIERPVQIVSEAAR
jgi:cell wall-associated NlpC family hydrolase